MKYYKLILILLIFSGCDVSTLSDEDTKNISKLKVNILIQDGTKDQSLNLIKVNLTDGEKQIINEKIKILLNGKPLELFVRTGNYYDKTSYYATDDLLRSESYYFEIILPDSSNYPLAYIKPNKIPTEFNFPKNISINKDFILKWTKLNTPFEFEYIKGVEYERETGQADNVTRSGYDGKRIDTLTSKVGEYIIPKSYFIVSKQRTKWLRATLSSKEAGLINPNLFKNSSITYNYTIEKIIDVKEE